MSKYSVECSSTDGQQEAFPAQILVTKHLCIRWFMYVTIINRVSRTSTQGSFMLTSIPGLLLLRCVMQYHHGQTENWMELYSSFNHLFLSCCLPCTILPYLKDTGVTDREDCLCQNYKLFKMYNVLKNGTHKLWYDQMRYD